MKRHTQQFVRQYLVITVCLLGALVLFNTVVDPYNIYPWVHLTRLLPHKPNNDHRRTKAGQVRQSPGWDTLLMGSSHAEVGLDAKHPAFALGRAFNLGLNGGRLAENLGALRYAWQWGHPIKRVVLVYDNRWFFQAPLTTTDYIESPFNPGYSVIEYQGSNLLGMQATEHSYHAIRKWWRGQGATNDEFGRRIRPLFGPDTAQHDVFVGDLAKPELQKPVHDDGPNLDLFEQFARFCLDREIELIVTIPPCHANMLDLFERQGYNPARETGKRRLLQRVIALNQAYPGAPPINLWDFSGISPYTTEPVPPPGDTQTRLRWFWDPDHFKKELGDLMLDRALGQATPDNTLGTRLTPDTIDQHLKALRQHYQHFTAQQTDPTHDPPGAPPVH